MEVNEDECRAAGLDPKKVEILRVRQERLLADMYKAGVGLFCGSDSSLRPVRGDTKLILAGIKSGRTDGGCGASQLCADGLFRGE